ncbi:Na+/H+ antiporter subunit C [Paradevosia shaoguanensis]|jgi:multicomponent Na+:H+ antiporter subunit C|uniref:Na+/H+ antiporter subunit C n=1 Tax=Paradevosia shaoguanensis TaxID=1335043 RepID=UPI000455BCF7|nr:Na+/H+ antiporter subunit C [Paradevosia shaoguanensis]CDP51702.1 Na(+) H(+) antiporter subunit C [Devosia sp. DBB001]
MIETAFAALVGVFFAAAIYLLLSRSVIRMLLGLTLFGNAVNLLIFTAGRLTREVPPIVPNGMQVPAAPIANPLPQALILTAIVIGFAMFTFLLVLAYRAYQSLNADNTDTMRLTEPRGGPNPPLSY